MASSPPPPPFTPEQLLWLSDHGGDLLGSGSSSVEPPTDSMSGERPPGASRGYLEESTTPVGTGESRGHHDMGGMIRLCANGDIGVTIGMAPLLSLITPWVTRVDTELT